MKAADQKKHLCALLRSTGNLFIEGTTGQSPSDRRDAALLRHQTDCLITAFESGQLDPVLLLQNLNLNPEEDASLHASQPS